MTLSDSLFEACETIYDSVRSYEYSDDYQKEMISALVELEYIGYKLDRLPQDQIWGRKEVRENIVLPKWRAAVCERLGQ